MSVVASRVHRYCLRIKPPRVWACRERCRQGYTAPSAYTNVLDRRFPGKLAGQRITAEAPVATGRLSTAAGSLRHYNGTLGSGLRQKFQLANDPFPPETMGA